MKYGLSENQLGELLAILKVQPEVEEAVLFGSRAMDTFKEASDIDIAVKGEGITQKIMLTLLDAFEESNLPFFVDVVNYQIIDKPKFKQHIDRKGISLFLKGMGEWRECKLGEVVNLKRGHDLPKRLRKEGSIPIYSSSGISGFHNESIADGTGVITGRYGTIGKLFLAKEPYWPLNTTLYVDNFKGNNKIFIYYFLQQINWEQFNDKSAVPGVNRNDVHKEEVYLPPLLEQKAIASVLSCLDDKIDLLHRQNKTLEAIAETLFRQWFIEEAQDDWDKVEITKLFEVRDGTHDSPKQKLDGKPLLTSKHILNNKLDIESAYLISEEDFENVNKRSKVETNDILLSMIGTIGLIYIEHSHTVDYAIKNIGLFKTSQNPEWALYTYLWLKSTIGKQFINEHRSGSTQEYIALGSLRSIVFKIPTDGLINKFNKDISPFFSKLKKNIEQIKTLEKLRDTLLPKLMGGEVRVNMEAGHA